MAVRDIVRMGHPVLRKNAIAYPREKIGAPAFATLIADMKDTMANAGGIGLAAPQINESVQIAVIEVPTSGSRYGDHEALPFAVYINPVVTVLDAETAGYWEGCLSVPGLMGYVERPQHVRIDYIDEYNQAKSLVAQGFTATVFQHELDHLIGRLYVDRLADTTQLAYVEEYAAFIAQDGSTERASDPPDE